MTSKLNSYLQLIRFNKPIGTFLLLWPTLWALWIAAQGMPPLKFLLIFITGTFIMRSAGCVINDIADRNFDGHVERTRHRPLAAGKLTLADALWFLFSLLLVALGLVLLLNTLALRLAIVGVLVVAIYPFMKRFTHLPQLVLGVAFAWPIPMVFAAVTNSMPWHAWLLFIIGFIWPIAYDTYYAMADREDDLKIGVKSTAILFAEYDRLVIAALQTMMLGLLVILGLMLQVGFVYFISLCVAAGLFIQQYTSTQQRDPAKCFRAFLNNNWVGAAIFLGLCLSYFLK